MSNNNVTIRKTTYTSDKVIIIVAILGLIFIIIYIYNNYKSLAIKPTGASLGTSCPDYWDSIGNSKCQNTNGLGSCSKIDGANIMDFSSDVFTNKNTGDYAKCKWAKACNVSWGHYDRVC